MEFFCPRWMNTADNALATVKPAASAHQKVDETTAAVAGFAALPPSARAQVPLTPTKPNIAHLATWSHGDGGYTD
jgi:hypothetical protein